MLGRHHLLGLIFGIFLISGLFNFNSVRCQEDAVDDEATVESDEKADAANAKNAAKETIDEAKKERDSALQDQKAKKEAVIKEAGAPPKQEQTETTSDVSSGGPEEEFPDGLPKPSPAAEARLVFIDPNIGQIPRASGLKGSLVPLEVPVARQVNVLISLKHKGGMESKEGFYLDAVAGSLRYPMDYSYYIQNFTAQRLNDLHVEPLKHATIDYSFVPAQQLMSRPYGLTLRVFYHDLAGQTYVQTVMNETVTLVEFDYSSVSGSIFDTETIFLYLVMSGLVILLLLVLYQLWLTYGPKQKRGGLFGGNSKSSGRSNANSNGSDRGRAGKDKQNAANGDANDAALQEAAAAVLARGVDPEWIPRDVLLREASKRSPEPQSPRQRKSKRDQTAK